MTACAQVPVPISLTPEVRADVAYRRARGDSWEAVGAALQLDADALRRAADADPLFVAAYERAWAEAAREAEREAEAAALRRLQKLTASENEEVALRASVVLVRYALECRRADARRKPISPRTPPAEPKAAPTARNEDAGARPVPAVAPARVVPMG
jgi:hypothetical protein